MVLLSFNNFQYGEISEVGEAPLVLHDNNLYLSNKDDTMIRSAAKIHDESLLMRCKKP